MDERFLDALTEAEEIDARLAALSEEERADLFREKPFLGIPFSTKDWFTVRGLSWTSGLLARKGLKGNVDAPVVAAMKAAGGIMVGVTNVSELCMWMESNNKVYGRTCNPYHTGRTVGGSSGGEGCVISAGGSPWGIGSDVGGSIRIPSFFNGIFGHKPSAGIVDNSGHVPQARGIINNVFLGWYGNVWQCLTLIAGTGPMCRHAEDLSPMLQVLAGERAELLNLQQPVDISELKFYFLPDDGGFPLVSPVQSDLRQAQARLLQRFREKWSVRTELANLPDFYHSLLIWTNSMSSEPTMEPFCAELAEARIASYDNKCSQV